VKDASIMVGGTALQYQDLWELNRS